MGLSCRGPIEHIAETYEEFREHCVERDALQENDTDAQMWVDLKEGALTLWKGEDAMRSTALLLLTLCCLTIVGMTQSKRAAAEDKAMTAGDLQQICIDSSAESKAACRFYLLGIKQGISMGMSIADGKTQGGRPCVPDNLSASAIELAVKLKLGEDLMVFPDDRKLDASGVVGAILVSTFPCRKSN